MKRSTARWTTAMAAAALIGLPAAGFAQTPAQQTPPATQTTPAPTSTQGQTTATSAADHIREAKQALEAVPAASVPAGSRQKLAEIKTHLNNLDKIVASSDKAATSGSATAKSGAKKGESWGTEAAAIDKLVSDLTATSTDDAAKEKLMEVRRHVTELASSMSGTSQDAAASSPAAAGADTMGASPSASSQSAQPSPSTSPTPSSTDPSAAGAGTYPQSTPPSSTPQQQPPATPEQQPAAQGQVDAQAAKQHLSEARDSLAQLTSLPEASKLQGEARNQVSQLISNFNELITTQGDWKAAYAKVSANLDTLIGADSTSPSAAGTTGAPGAPPATAGTTGTTGAAAPSMQVEPAIKTKLQEFRTHLKEFEQAAGGVNAAAGATAGAMAPSANPSATANPASPSSPANPPSPTPTSEPTSPSPAPTSASPAPTQTAGASGVPGATGTSGTMAPKPGDDQAAKPAAGAGHAEADKHIDAIQEILSKAKDGKLDKEQTEQIKTHLDQLRQLIGQAK